jgi:hypothetical protein
MKRGKCNGAVNGVVNGVVDRVVNGVVDRVVDWETSRGSDSRQGLGLAEGRRGRCRAQPVIECIRCINMTTRGPSIKIQRLLASSLTLYRTLRLSIAS